MANQLCLVFHYYEASQTYKDNLLHFLLFGYSPAIDYYFVISGEHTVDLPQLENVHYLFTRNLNHDYGAYSHALHHGIPLEQYEEFIFINSSVRGPFLPAYLQTPWSTLLTGQLTAEVALAGTTINILPTASHYSVEFQNRHGGDGPYSHVQSMVFALKRDTLQFLKEAVFKETDEAIEKNRLVVDYEILMSQALIRRGFNIKCLLPEYNQLDYRRPHGEINPTAVNGDPCYEGAYFGRTLHPLESVFVKTNRAMLPEHFLGKVAHSMLRHGIRFPADQLTGSLREYMGKIAAPDLASAMPSSQDQAAHQKLARIVTAMNEILRS